MHARNAVEVDAAVVDAFRRGDEEAFGRISRRHFRELHVHCYRMIGSFDDAEDLVQDTLMRAWRGRDSYEGRATIRAWLYGIATHACLDAIRRRVPRGEALEAADATEATEGQGEDATAAGVPKYAAFPWMQPYPDALLDVGGADRSEPPDARLVARETIELAFLATIQVLPAKQRAVLILRDVLDFSAAETADILDDSVAAVNSALQRARATVRARRATPGDEGAPARSSGAAPSATAPSAAASSTAAPSTAARPTFSDAVFLQAYMDAAQRGDVPAIVDLLRDDVRMTLLPDGVTWDGRHDVACELFDRQKDFGDARLVAVAANRQPAIAVYRRRAGDAEYRAWAIVLLGVAEGKLHEIATFASPELFTRFDLPPTLPPTLPPPIPPTIPPHR